METRDLRASGRRDRTGHSFPREKKALVTLACGLGDSNGAHWVAARRPSSRRRVAIAMSPSTRRLRYPKQ